MAPVASAANVCDSFVRKAVTASAPSCPSLPPSILNIFKLSSKESLVTSIVKGSFVLSPPTVEPTPPKVIEPLTCPVPLVTSATNVGSVNGLPPASLIVISPASTVPLKFC